MPVTKLHTGFNIEVEFTISAFHKRLLAWFIDLIVILAYTWLVNKFVDTFKAGPFDSSPGLAGYSCMDSGSTVFPDR